MTALSRTDRRCARARACTRLAQAHRARYLEIRADVLAVKGPGANKSTVRNLVTARLARQFKAEYRELYVQECEVLRADARKLTADYEVVAGALDSSFLTDPRRRCAPEHGGPRLWTSSSTHDQHEAKKLCKRQCPFTERCADWAAANQEVWHVWGGVIRSSERERKLDNVRRAERVGLAA